MTGSRANTQCGTRCRPGLWASMHECWMGIQRRAGLACTGAKSMNENRLLTLSIALIGLLAASHATAQTITTRTSRLNFGYVYGAGGDSHTDSNLVEDFALLPTDTETTGYSGSTGGTLPNGQDYTAGVESDI